MAQKTFAYPAFMVDADTLASLQRRHVDTLTVASRILADGLKAAAKQQSDRMRTTVERFVDVSKLAAAEPAAYQPNEQFAAMKAAYLTALDDANTLAGLMLEAQAEAAKVVTRGLLANVDDLMGATKAA